MSETHDEMQVFAADQGLLVWGPSRALDLLDQAEDVRAKVVTPSLVAKLGTLVQGSPRLSWRGHAISGWTTSPMRRSRPWA
ncbi:hypothetical protein ACH0BW_01650 [Micrococcus luteus]|uniref:hypothetical protein n=1 Tax=Micrococcus luteus TaxID=1270 RepID=UPI003879DF88